MATRHSKMIQAAMLSLSLALPASDALAVTRHHVVRYHRHHYSQTRGAVIGAVAGAVIDHKKPLQGALIGAAVGDAVQMVRNHKH